MKAFIDDSIIISTREIDSRVILERLDEIVITIRMRFKPKKFRILSLRKDRGDETVTFRLDVQVILSLSEKPFKSLGRWYDDSLKDTNLGKETKQMT